MAVAATPDFYRIGACDGGVAGFGAGFILPAAQARQVVRDALIEHNVPSPRVEDRSDEGDEIAEEEVVGPDIVPRLDVIVDTGAGRIVAEGIHSHRVRCTASGGYEAQKQKGKAEQSVHTDSV
jgi:hypothetical protein